MIAQAVRRFKSCASRHLRSYVRVLVMTGRELIEWIKSNNAEDMLVAVQYRDDGGDYSGGEFISHPTLAHTWGTGIAYDERIEIDYARIYPANTIVL